MDTLQIAIWLKSVLGGDAVIQEGVEGRVYLDRAQQGAPLPYVLYSLQSGTDGEAGMCGARDGSAIVYLVKAVGDGGNYDALAAVVERIEALLQGANVTAPVRAHVARIAPVQYPEPVSGGGFYQHLGGLYRFTTQNDIGSTA